MEIDILQGYDHYFDPKGDRLDLCFNRKTIYYKNIKVTLNKLPYLFNEISSEIFFTTRAVCIIENYVKEAIGNGHKETLINQFNRFNRGKFQMAKDTKFKYSPVEHFFIPCLIRNIPSDGYLTPVYFNKNVLIKFEHAEGYQLDRWTATAGSIKKIDEYEIPYGINRSGSVIMWLGDIVKLTSCDLMYLYSENIEPQYDLHSDFYRNQILNEWL